MSKKDLLSIPTISRWQPDFRYRDDKRIDVELNNCKIISSSVTDKEAYRVTLASLRGTLSASGLGSPTQGSYSIPAGKDYDPRFDFSFLNRPDLTIVQLDEYIEDFRSRLESADGELRKRIESELDLVEKTRADLVAKQDNNSDSKTD